jgi:hypothetical protein
MLVVLEDAIVIFVHIIEDHQLNDLLHVTQFRAKWQLAPFYRTVAIYTVSLAGGWQAI